MGGKYAYIRYEGDEELWHEHYLVMKAEGSPSSDVILTADDDMYIENVSSPPHLGVVVGDARHTLPAELGTARGRPVYRFARGLRVREIQAARARAVTILAHDRARRRVPVPEPGGSSVGAAGAALSAAAPRPGKWAVAEPSGDYQVGDEIMLSASAVALGDVGVDLADGVVVRVQRLGAGPAASSEFRDHRLRDFKRWSEPVVPDAAPDAGDDDVRTLSVKIGSDGSRRRNYREAAESMIEVDFSDWPLEGPRTCAWVAREVARVAEGPRSQHGLWVRGSRIPDGDRAIHEDLVLATMFETSVFYDCLNVANLATMEVLCRRRQLLAEAHSANPAAPSYEGGDYFLGTGSRPGGAIVAPSLTSFVSERLRADAAILKEKRKLAEARNLRTAAAPKKGGGKGAKADK